MPVYTLDCYWTMYARVHIEADSVEEAEKKAREADLPPGEYVQDSFETYPQEAETAPDDESSA